MEKKATIAEQSQSVSQHRKESKVIKINSLFIDFTVYGPLPVISANEGVKAAANQTTDAAAKDLQSSEQTSQIEAAANILLKINKQCLEIMKSGENKRAPKRRKYRSINDLMYRS